MTLPDIYKLTKTPECGHILLVTECDLCWNRAFRAMRLVRKEEEQRMRDSERNRKESLAMSMSFNPRGCPYCGYTIG